MAAACRPPYEIDGEQRAQADEHEREQPEPLGYYAKCDALQRKEALHTFTLGLQEVGVYGIFFIHSCAAEFDPIRPFDAYFLIFR